LTAKEAIFLKVYVIFLVNESGRVHLPLPGN